MLSEKKRRRNAQIKQEVNALRARDWSLKEALYAVSEKYYLHHKSVERIYYETRLPTDTG